MRVILGIGNPGKKYENTRHNIGFIVLDKFAEKLSLAIDKKCQNYKYVGSKLNTSPFFLVKPTTYVNLSGLAAQDICNKFEIPPEDLLIITDDLNLNEGKLRVRKSGGDGGHNGLKSLIYHLESNAFPRIRFGIGSDFSDGEMADFVLGKFSNSEMKNIENSIDFSVELIENFIKGGTKQMLDYFSSNASKLSKTTEND